MLHEVRREAVHAEGYISGETLRDAADPHHYVIISTWRSRLDWERWAASTDRIKAMERMRPLLSDDERIGVLEPV
jgi:heme-degrading monooxygenase HmoA